MAKPTMVCAGFQHHLHCTQLPQLPSLLLMRRCHFQPAPNPQTKFDRTDIPLTARPMALSENLWVCLEH